MNKKYHYFFCVCACMFKMCQISKEAYENYEIKIIDDKEYFCVNRRDLEIEPDYKTWAVKKCIKKTKIQIRINT